MKLSASDSKAELLCEVLSNKSDKEFMLISEDFSENSNETKSINMESQFPIASKSEIGSHDEIFTFTKTANSMLDISPFDESPNLESYTIKRTSLSSKVSNSRVNVINQTSSLMETSTEFSDAYNDRSCFLKTQKLNQAQPSRALH